MPGETAPQSWWSTLPGILTGLGTAATALTGLIAAISAWVAPSHTGASKSGELTFRAVVQSPCSPSDAPASQPRPGYVCAKFVSPLVAVDGQEYPVDACLHFADQCGRAVWQVFCDKVGFESIGGSENNVVNVSYVIGDKITCKSGPGQICNSQAYIVCYKHQ